MTPAPDDNVPADPLEYYKSLNPAAAAGASGATGSTGSTGSTGPTGATDAADSDDPLTYYKTTAQQDAQTKKPDQSQSKPPVYSTEDFIKHHLFQSGRDYLVNAGKALIPDFGEGDRQQAESIASIIRGTGRAGARILGRELPQNADDQTLQNLKDYVVNRFGSVDNFKRSMYNDWAGTLGDVSMFFGGVGAAGKALRLGKVAEGISTLGEAANPLFIPSKAASGAVKLMTKSRLPPGGFDPGDASFGATGETPTGGMPPQPPKAPPFDMDAAVAAAKKQKAYDLAGISMDPDVNRGQVPSADNWQQADEWVRNHPPKAPKLPKAAQSAASKTTPPPEQTKTNWGKEIRNAAITGAPVGIAVEALSHHLLGAVGGALTAGALKMLPVLLKSPEGQEFLMRLGPDSTTAAVAATARDMIPALNALYRTQQQVQSSQPFQLPGPRLLRSQGGPINPELARIQRERLRLPGIHEMLQCKA